MADEAEAQTPTSDAAAAAGTPQIDMEKVTPEQLEALFETGSAELPMVVSGEGEAGKKAEAKVEPPAKVEPAPKVEPEPVVEETRTPEQIVEAQTAAREKVKAEGGDETAQEAAAEEAAKPVAEAPVVPPVVEPEPENGEDRGDRFRFKNPTNRAIAALFRAREEAGTPVTWAEAEKLVKGDAAPAPVIVEKPDLRKAVTDLTTEVADIAKKLDDAGANEGVFGPEIAKLVQEHAKKSADLALAERDLRQETAQAEADARAAATQSETARNKSKARAIEAYGAECGDESTPFGQAVAKRIEELSNPNHPDHAILFADSAPWQVVRDVADELGIAAKKANPKPATPPPATPPVVPPKSKVLPPSGGKTSVPTAQPQEDAKKHLEHLRNDADVTVEELDAVFEPGGPGKTLHALVN